MPEVVIVSWSHYIHGVFDSQEKAEQYSERRWGKHWREIGDWRIEAFTVNCGAFEPGADEDGPAFAEGPVRLHPPR